MTYASRLLGRFLPPSVMDHLRVPLYRNGYALVFSSIASSGLGVLYWILAARFYPAEVVGLNSAVLSAIFFLANLAQFNLVNALNLFLPAAGRSSRRMILASYAVNALAALLVSLGFVAGINYFAPSLSFLVQNPLLVAAFVLSTMAWGVFVLQDSALTGIRQAVWVPVENVIFAVLKIALLIVLAALLPEYGILGSWILPLILALAVVNFFLFRRLVPRHESTPVAETRPPAVRQVARYMAGDYVGSLFWMAASHLQPIIITELAGAAANAHSYLPYQISYGLYLAGRMMGMSLVAEVAADPARLSAYSIRVIKQSFRLVIPAVALILVGAPWILLLFGREYSAEGANLLRLLSLAAVPQVIVQLYLSIARVQRKMAALILVQAVQSVLVLGLIYALLDRIGLDGIGVAWLVSQTLVALVLLATEMRPILLSQLNLSFALRLLSPLLARVRRPIQRRDDARRIHEANAVVSAALPEATRSFQFVPSSSWRAQEVLRTVNDVTVVTLGAPGKPASALLKLAGSDQSAASLRNQQKVLTRLFLDRRLEAWTNLLPRLISEGEMEGRYYQVETLLPGVDSRRLLDLPAPRGHLLRAAVAAVHPLHLHTASVVEVDQPLLDRWVGSRLEILRQVNPHRSPISGYNQGIAALSQELQDALAGRKVAAGWIHGDFTPGNILVSASGEQVEGLVDWELAAPGELPLIDIFSLLLSVRMHVQKRELGDVVRGLLEQEDWTPQERAVIAAAQEGLPGERLSPRALLLLTWLRHVTSNLSKSVRYAAHWYWLSRNVETVLDYLSAAGPVVPVSGRVGSRKEEIALANPALKERKSPLRAPAAPPSAGSHRSRVTSVMWTLLPVQLLALALLLWAFSLQNVDLRAMTDIGLLSVLPPTFYAALAVLSVSFILTVYRKPGQTPVLVSHLLLLVLIFHGTPSILYGTLRYSWAWKHVGIVDYIQRYGSINPNITFLEAYHNWPGFFALNAFIVEAAGMQNALEIARWSTLFFNLLFIGALYMIYRALTPNVRLRWMAIWFFFIGSWVGQDYFAPQTLNYFLYLALVGILLHWFRGGGLASLGAWLRRRSQNRVLRLFDNLLARAAPPETPFTSLPAQRVILMIMVIFFMAVITFSHQLTPFMVFGALAVLAVFGQTYTRSLPVLMLVMIFAWLWYGAAAYMGADLIDMLESVGALESNVASNLINLAQASPGQVIISLLGRGLTLAVILLGMLGGLMRLVKGRLDVSALLLIVVPFSMLFGSDYGGEILFRIFFFALPFLAFLIGGLFYPSDTAAPRWFAPAASTVFSLAMIVCFLFAYMGKEKQYYFTPEEVSAAEYLFNAAPPGSLIIEGTRNYPTLFRNYADYTYVPIAREPVDSRQRIIEDPVGVLRRWMSNRQYPAAYLLITRSQKAEIDMVGSMPAGSLDQIERALMQSGYFEVLYANQDAAIYIVKDR